MPATARDQTAPSCCADERRAILARLSNPQDLARLVSEARADLRRRFHAHPSGREHSAALSSLFDDVVCRLFDIALAEAAASVAPTGVEMAILATGGYGRRELCPRSDVDIAFVAAEEEDPFLDTVVRRMFFLIMDVFTVRSDVKVGYAFRVPEECGDLDFQTLTALLDGRCVAGSVTVARRLQDALYNALQPGALVYTLHRERQEACRRQGDSVYRAEPDVKEGPGGLRDLHVGAWVARAQVQGQEADAWALLVTAGDMTARQQAEVNEAHEFLLQVRHALHYACDRRFDTLSRARQGEVAGALGLGDAGALMARYYGHAETVRRLREAVVERAMGRPLPLGRGLVACRGEISSADPDRFRPELSEVLGVFATSQACGLPISSELGASLSQPAAAPVGESARAAAGRAFLDLLRASAGVAACLRQMARWGVLQRLIPEFGEALVLAPASPVHDYTVGEHALRTVAMLEELRAPDGREHSHTAEIFGEVNHPEVLFLAALLHDLGKRTDPARHATAGAEEARAVAYRLGMDADGAEAVAFLVRHHLLMSDTARLRDLTQERSIHDFVAVVNTPERLNKLFLLTHADLRATGGGVWTPVQERFLEDLYYRALRALSTPEPAADPAARVLRHRRRMQRELSLQNLHAEAVQEHCNAMPPAYLLNTPIETIAQHIRMVERLKAEGPIVEFLDEPGRDFTMVALCTYDDPAPGLLSKIASALYAHNIDVHAAQVYTRDGAPAVAIDTLWVDSDGRRLRSFERAALEKDLRDVLSGQVTAEELLRRQGRPPQTDLTGADVRAHNDVSETHTVIEVRLPDRRGLLYGLTRRLSELGWDIHSARINTIGGEARDAFYVTDSCGLKLNEDSETIRRRLLG